MAVAFALFFIPFEEFLHSFFYFHFVCPSERMQFAYVNEFSHGAVGLAGVKLMVPSKPTALATRCDSWRMVSSLPVPTLMWQLYKSHPDR